RSIRPSPNGLPAVRVQQIRLGLPGCPRNSTRRESKGSLRNLSLQLRRHPRLGLFPDQHGAPDQGRTEPAGFAGLPGQHRPCVSALPGARFPAVEHVQQRRLSQVLAESLRRASALQGEDADGLGTLIQRYFLEGRFWPISPSATNRQLGFLNAAASASINPRMESHPLRLFAWSAELPLASLATVIRSGRDMV